MRLHQSQVETIKQPIQLLTGERDQLVFCLRPVKLLFGQCLVIQHKTIVFPEQALDFGALPVTKDVESSVEHVMAKLVFDQS